MTRVFRAEALSVVLTHIRERIAEDRSVTIEVPDPDRGHGRYPGEELDHARHACRHRPLRVWTDLADRLELRLHTPIRRGDRIALTFSKLDPAASLLQRDVRGPGKYAPSSGFGRVSKLEDPDFLIDFDDALQRCNLSDRPRVLSLGVNRGDELVPVLDRHPDATCTGVDHDAEALGVARERLGSHHQFIEADLNALPELPRHDLVVCIDTLQSPGVDDRVLLRHIVQHLLEPQGSVIVGLPNCRYLDGELLHGTRMVNFRQPELSLLFKAAAFYKKYFQQHHKRVFVTGKHELLITAIPTNAS